MRLFFSVFFILTLFLNNLMALSPTLEEITRPMGTPIKTNKPISINKTQLPTKVKFSNSETRAILGKKNYLYLYVEIYGVQGWVSNYFINLKTKPPTVAPMSLKMEIKGFVEGVSEIYLTKGTKLWISGQTTGKYLVTVKSKRGVIKINDAIKYGVYSSSKTKKISKPPQIINKKFSTSNSQKNPYKRNRTTKPVTKLNFSTTDNNIPNLNKSTSTAQKKLGPLYMDETKMDDPTITILLDSMNGETTDGNKIMENLADEEKNFVESGNGDFLKIVDVKTPKSPIKPGATIKLKIKVRNNATSGLPATFDLGISNAYGDTTPMALKKNLSLKAGESKTFTLSITAPHDSQLISWAWIDPQIFSGDELPSIPVNLDIYWNGETMSNEEILKELNDKIIDHRYKIPDNEKKSWIARYKKFPTETLGDIANESMAYVRELDRIELEKWRNDPEEIKEREADEIAQRESAKLQEFLSLENWARSQSRLQGIDLARILEDMIYVDDNAKVHGNLAAVRAKLNQIIREKNGTDKLSSVEKWLLNDSPLNCSEFHKQNQELLSTSTTLISSLNPADITTDRLSQNSLNELMNEYKKLMTSYHSSNTNPQIFKKDLASLNKKLSTLKIEVKTNPKLNSLIKSMETKLSKMNNIIKKAGEFQKKADKLLKKSRLFKSSGKAISTMGDLCSLYDIGERSNARIKSGEDSTKVLSEELLKWNVKKAVTQNPVVAAADTIMSGVGTIAYLCNKKKYDAEGFDPRQYNASTLVDLGVDGNIALLSDASYNMGKLTAKKEKLTDEEREILTQRLKLFEKKLSKVKDPEIKERLLTSRKYIREILNGR